MKSVFLHPVKSLALGFVSVFLMAMPVQAEDTAQRIVSVGGAITEIVFALGEQDRLVARDTTSNYPAEARELPDVGYIRRLSPEGVLSVNPDMILAQEGAGPPEAVELLREAAIEMVEIPEGYTGEAVLAKIRGVAAALGVPEKGDALATEIEAKIATAKNTIAEAGGEPRRVLFILTMQGGRLMAAGRNSSADGIIKLAGGVNALDGFEGYKPVTDEAIIQSNADVILMMNRISQMGVTDEDLFNHPAISATPAAQNRAVVKMDGMKMLGFSVRTAEAATELAEALAKAGI